MPPKSQRVEAPHVKNKSKVFAPKVAVQLAVEALKTHPQWIVAFVAFEFFAIPLSFWMSGWTSVLYSLVCNVIATWFGLKAAYRVIRYTSEWT